MGFFSELKEDLSQAVNEIVEDENVTVDEKETESQVGAIEPEPDEFIALQEEIDQASMSEFELQDANVDALDLELEKLLENVDEIVVPEQFEDKTIEGLEEILEQNDLEKEMLVEEKIEPEVVEIEMPIVEETIESLEKQEMKMGVRAMEHKNATDDVAVITAGMTIRGDLEAEGNVDLFGTINGNIDILGKLNVTGVINGNSQADEIYADNAKITGDIKSEGSTKIGQNTVIIGNVYAKSAVIAGAVKGDIDVQGPVILDSSAIVMGNIKSKAVQINNGAVIEGMCSQCYADVSPTVFFDEINNRMNK